MSIANSQAPQASGHEAASLFSAAHGYPLHSPEPLSASDRERSGRSGVGGLRPYYDAEGVTIYHGDCRVIVPLLPDFDLLLTDPPYGIGADNAAHKASGNVVGHGHRRVAKRTYAASDWDARPPEDWLLGMLRAKCAKQIIWGGNYYPLPPCKGPLIWDKEINGNFADGEQAWNNLGCPLRIKRHLWNGMARKGSEQRFDHPTQKPLELMAWCIALAGDVQTILDPFAGTGTTGRAAKDLGKRAVLIEREERFCEIAAQRLAQSVLPLAGGGGAERLGEPTCAAEATDNRC